MHPWHKKNEISNDETAIWNEICIKHEYFNENEKKKRTVALCNSMTKLFAEILLLSGMK